ncbi:glutamine-dependent NAD(+) synthetase-like [Penaeus monodon]|uniref:glutamine-dependent NAD(+) synthetase-like n=1 Tax=Penaeus monodon TaxID=6687 RepID=UPI0018A7C3B1|nr:glutamine-dependent NAD(+) synthetase-like [Penaeus monodon]
MILADDGSAGYCETRWFTPWAKVRQVEDHRLPPCISQVTGQTTVPFGDALLVTSDTCIGFEICEELYNPESPHVPQYLDGAEIVSNSLGAYEEFQRPESAVSLVSSATMKSGGCYLYANQRGCDGGPGYYPGEAYIALNGAVVGRAAPYSLREVEVVVAKVDLESVRRQKALIRSRCAHAARSEVYPRVQADFWLCSDADEGGPSIPPFPTPLAITPPPPEEQALSGPACWLWDFLRRSGRRGLLLPLEADIDSSLTAAIVVRMCRLVVKAVASGDEKVLSDIRRIVGQEDYVPNENRDLCRRLVRTLCLQGEGRSARHLALAEALAKDMGSRHTTADLSGAVRAMQAALETASQVKPDAASRRDLLSRLRMSFAFLCAQASTKEEGEEEEGEKEKGNTEDSSGHLLVLTSANCDLLASGKWVKFGHFSGDVNLVGRFPEEVVKRAVETATHSLALPSLADILHEHEKRRRKMKNCEEGIGEGREEEVGKGKGREGKGKEEVRKGREEVGKGEEGKEEIKRRERERKKQETNEEETGETKEEEGKEGEEGVPDGAMSMEEVALFRQLQYGEGCGPYSMFGKLCWLWGGRRAAQEIACKVKTYFRNYSNLQHKICNATRTYYVPGTGPLEDARPIVSSAKWTWQFNAIDLAVQKKEKQEETK